MALSVGCFLLTVLLDRVKTPQGSLSPVETPQKKVCEWCWTCPGPLHWGCCGAADSFGPGEAGLAAEAGGEPASPDPELSLGVPLTWLNTEMEDGEFVKAMMSSAPQKNRTHPHLVEVGPASYRGAQPWQPVSARSPRRQAGRKKRPAAPGETLSGPPAEVSAGALIGHSTDTNY